MGEMGEMRREKKIFVFARYGDYASKGLRP